MENKMDKQTEQPELTKEMIMTWLKENWKPIYYIAISLEYQKNK